ncbi:MAG: carbohydrate ABC transporter permease [Clostridiales bacterium]|nr:carbohydrate ABC transporter permease [Clostridiales bacterium]
MKARFNLQKEIRLIPGYAILIFWVVFTFIVLGWVLAASFSTTRDIFTGEAFKFSTGLHFENYEKAWNAQNVSVFFTNSLFYSTISTFLLIVIAAPAAYALSRFKFIANKFIQSGLVAAMGVPVVMIILPLFSLVAGLNILSNDLFIRVLMIFLYTGINVPFAIIFLLSFFANLSHHYEEAAGIDGCSPIKTFWKIMLPLAQPGIITLSVFCFINIWNEYFLSLIFASGNTVKPVAVGLYSMIQSMKYTGDWAGMFASVIIVFLPTFVLYIALHKRIISSITGGGVKG